MKEMYIDSKDETVYRNWGFEENEIKQIIKKEVIESSFLLEEEFDFKFVKLSSLKGEGLATQPSAKRFV